MGQDWRPDRATTPQLMECLMEKIEDRIKVKNVDLSLRQRILMAGAYFVFTYVNSLRGPEGLLVDLEGCRRNFLKGLDKNYVIVTLLGLVKGEHGEQQHLLSTASVTGSGIKVHRWMQRLLAAN
jgi:hypothetical protein